MRISYIIYDTNTLCALFLILSNSVPNFQIRSVNILRAYCKQLLLYLMAF